MVRICDTRTNSLVRPVGVTQAPRFSWKLESDKRGVLQMGYRISVTDESGQCVWDSGEVPSAQSHGVLYGGKPLASCRTYRWSVAVTVKDETGRQENAASTAETFTTGVLNASLWKARWIEPREDTVPGQMMPVQYLRKRFAVDGKVKKAWILQTAHGLYEFWINGKRVTNEKFKPGFTSYYMRLQYQMYDITAALLPGENLWAVQLADGWWRGVTGGDIRNNFGTKTAFFGQILLEYSDGTTAVICTDESFVASTGGLLFADMKLGESYDARLEPQGWQEMQFDDSLWQPVREASYAVDNLIPSLSVPVLEHESFAAMPFRDANGDMVIDFGQNIAGYAAITFRGLRPGQQITMEFGEDFKDGAFYNENISHGTPIAGLERFQQVDYTAHGDAVETYCPSFSVFGFQYLRVRGYDGNVQPGDFRAIAVYSDCPEAGDFRCSNELVNKLVCNSRWSQKGNFLDVPTDCPTRERSPWTGDSQIYAKTAGWFADVYPFFEKWLQDVAAEQCENGKVLNIVPNCMMPHDEAQIAAAKEAMRQMAEAQKDNPGNDPAMSIMSSIYADDGAYIIDGSCGWGDTAVITPWVMYLRYGNQHILENQYESAKKWVDYMARNAANPNPMQGDVPWYHPEAGEDGQYIWDSRYQWGEWLEPDVPNAVMNGADAFIRPDPEAPTAFLCYSARLVSRMAEIMGKAEDCKFYRDYSERVRAAYNKYLIHSDGVIKEGRQAPHVRALAFGLCTGETKKAVAAYLNRLIVQNGYILNTGFLSTAELLNVLCDNGYSETAYRLLLQEKCPGWLYNVKAGATTIPETWDAKVTHKESMNHYSYGAVCDFLFSRCCGISWDEKEPGFRHFCLSPKPTEAFAFAEAAYDSVYGRIESEWYRTEHEIVYRFLIPANTTADLLLPGGTSKTVGSGEYIFKEEM